MAILALERPVFKPAMRIIQSITNTYPCLITTTFDHGYISGTIVRFDIPPGFGITQLNQQFGPIDVTGPTTFTVPIDTSEYDVFTIPINPYLTPATSDQQAQVVPIGEINSILTAAVTNVLPY